MATYNSNGSQSDVVAKIAGATAGDTITIPAGSFTWGAGNTGIAVNKAITLIGAGEGSTTIVLASDGPYFGSGVISISAAAIVGGFTVTGAVNGAQSTTPISASGTGWRVHHITYNGPASPGYFAYCSAGSGLFDHITINAGHASLQTFMVRGDATAWDNPHTMGTSNAIFLEDSTINGDCYVCEGDGSARLVIRYCLITGQSQIDMHQIETSTDVAGIYHGGRQLENYGNRWSYTLSRYFSSGAMDIKAGTGMNFDNTADFTPLILLQPYGTQGLFWNTNFTTPVSIGGTKYITPAQIPTRDYIGVGPTPCAQGKEPMYFWNNIQNTANIDFNVAQNSDWPVNVMEANVNAGAIAQYGSTFLAADIVQIDSSYFYGPVGTAFTGAGGVGRGTKATMLALNMSGRTKKVGFWVTDEGSWKAGASGTSGQLYQWNGSSWVLYYTPYAYPHPLASGVSTVADPSISPAAGSYVGTQSITISCATSGASIRYTTDGSTPSDTVGTVYSTPITVAATTVIKAIAYKSGMDNSSVSSAAYTISEAPASPLTFTSLTVTTLQFA